MRFSKVVVSMMLAAVVSAPAFAQRSAATAQVDSICQSNRSKDVARLCMRRDSIAAKMAQSIVKMVDGCMEALEIFAQNQLVYSAALSLKAAPADLSSIHSLFGRSAKLIMSEGCTLVLPEILETYPEQKKVYEDARFFFKNGKLPASSQTKTPAKSSRG